MPPASRHLCRLVALALSIAPAVSVAGDENPTTPAKLPPPSAVETALRARVTSWMTARRKVSAPCAVCGGDGKVSVDLGKRYEIRRCDACDGTGRVANREQAKIIIEDVYSPVSLQYRRDQRVRSGGSAAMSPNGAVLMSLKDWRLDAIRLVNDRRAVVAVTEDLIYPVTYRWFVPADAKSDESHWFLWNDKADEAWDLPPSPGDDRERLRSTPLTEKDAKDVDTALAGAGIAWKAQDLRADGSGLLLEFPLPVNVERAAVVLGAVRTLRTLLAKDTRWDSVRLTYVAWWQDGAGKRSQAPYVVVSLNRGAALRIRWESLRASEAWALFYVDENSVEGLSPLVK